MPRHHLVSAPVGNDTRTRTSAANAKSLRHCHAFSGDDNLTSSGSALSASVADDGAFLRSSNVFADVDDLAIGEVAPHDAAPSDTEVSEGKLQLRKTPVFVDDAVDVTTNVAGRVVSELRARRALASAIKTAVETEIRQHKLVRVNDERFQPSVAQEFYASRNALNETTYPQNCLRELRSYLITGVGDDIGTHKRDGYYFFAENPAVYAPISEDVKEAVVAVLAGSRREDVGTPVAGRYVTRYSCSGSACSISPPLAAGAGDECEVCGSPLVGTHTPAGPLVEEKWVEALRSRFEKKPRQLSRLTGALAALMRPDLNVHITDGANDGGVDVRVDHPSVGVSVPVAAQLWQVKFQRSPVGEDVLDQLYGTREKFIRRGTATAETELYVVSTSGFSRQAQKQAEEFQITLLGPAELYYCCPDVELDSSIVIDDLCRMSGVVSDSVGHSA